MCNSLLHQIDGKCGVWRRRTSKQHQTILVSCFCNAENCNTPAFAQDRISAALADKSESAWSLSNMESMEVEHSNARFDLLECLRKNVEKRNFQNISADGGPPSTIERNLSLGNWALIGAVILLLFVCVVFLIVTRRGRKIQNDLKSSRLSIVELEITEKDIACNKKKPVGEVKTLEELSDSAESSKERDGNDG
ncbi:hypothetical protein Y032_0147g2563 [Ancylostoma ceylanicum]|uniref:Uncharacterized protein n=1 Tax=Ancylostoma ceylanicum TaxID=53326 RepID=A0A016T155_9BILA|nr:hypothetical protein Y032_0147g2563 [Ancylostoma ceylanicum]